MRLTSCVLNQQPVGLVVPLPDLKDHCGNLTNGDDGKITAYAMASQDFLERELGCCLLPQTWTETYDLFPRWTGEYAEIRLTKYPVTAINSLTYYDGNGNQQTLTSANLFYTLPSSRQATVMPGLLSGAAQNSWPAEYRFRPDCIAINYSCAWVPVPEMAKHIIKFLVDFNLDGNRGSNDLEYPPGLDRMMRLLETGTYV